MMLYPQADQPQSQPDGESIASHPPESTSHHREYSGVPLDTPVMRGVPNIKLPSEHLPPLAPAFSPLFARELSARGLTTDEQRRAFFNPDVDLHVPPVEKIKGASELVAACRGVIERGGTIGLASDYDADGITSAAILFHAITELGGAVSIFSPDRRTEGFGLNARIVREAQESGVDLLVCLDYGSLAVHELALVKHLGMQGAVIDHHHVTEQRAAIDAILVNPHQEGCQSPDCGLTSAGLSWVVARELLVRGRGEEGSSISRDLAAIAAIGTVADVGDCTLANRAITAAGLQRLQECMTTGAVPPSLQGVLGLVQAVTTSRILTARSIGFEIGPTINAAGRIATAEPTGTGSACLPIRILCGQAAESRLDDIAELVATNARRRVLTEVIAKEARAAAQVQGDQEVIVVGDPQWHEGVVGIVAARLAEEFQKPAFVFGGGQGGIAKGSGRNPGSMSVGGVQQRSFDLATALDAVGPTHADGWGGHTNAAGVATRFDRCANLQTALCAEFRRQGVSPPLPSHGWSSEATLAEVARYGAQFCSESALLEPCDARSNPVPHLRIAGTQIVGVTTTAHGGTLVTLRQQDPSGSDVYVTGRLVGSARNNPPTQGDLVSVIATIHLDRYRHARFRSQDVLLEIAAIDRAGQ